MCDEWRFSPDQFFLDMHKKYRKGLTIHRIDNDKGYSKENCMWATRKIQHRNTCRSKKLQYNGVEMHLRDILETLDIERYKSFVYSKANKFKTWDEYLEMHGIVFQNRVYCCAKQLLDELKISSYRMRSLMRRYYRYSNKTIKDSKLSNLKWYMDNCYNFSNNILKLSRKEKLYKFDIVA